MTISLSRPIHWAVVCLLLLFGADFVEASESLKAELSYITLAGVSSRNQQKANTIQAYAREEARFNAEQDVLDIEYRGEIVIPNVFGNSDCSDETLLEAIRFAVREPFKQNLERKLAQGTDLLGFVITPNTQPPGCDENTTDYRSGFNFPAITWGGYDYQRLAGDPAVVLINLAEFIPLLPEDSEVNHQNSENKFDVNADGEISAVDALIAINLLNRGQKLPSSGFFTVGDRNSIIFPDVNGDGHLSAIDPLSVINVLNSPAAAAEGEASGSSGFSYSLMRSFKVNRNGLVYYNWANHREIWLKGRNNRWHYLLPNGKLYRLDSGMGRAGMVVADTLVATVGQETYHNLNLLPSISKSQADAVYRQIVGPGRKNLNIRMGRRTHFNWGGHQELWLKDLRYRWVYLTPDGKLYRPDSGLGKRGLVSHDTLLLDLDASYYEDLSKFPGIGG